LEIAWAQPCKINNIPIKTKRDLYFMKIIFFIFLHSFFYFIKFYLFKKKVSTGLVKIQKACPFEDPIPFKAS